MVWNSSGEATEDREDGVVQVNNPVIRLPTLETEQLGTDRLCVENRAEVLVLDFILLDIAFQNVEALRRNDVDALPGDRHRS